MLKSLGALCALIAATWGGYLAADLRWLPRTEFAAAEQQTQAVLTTIREQFLRSDLRALKRERFDLEVQQRQRSLLPVERQRLDEIKVDMDTLAESLKTLKPTAGSP